MGWVREAQEGENIYIVMTSLHCCMIETNTTLQSNYRPIRKYKRDSQTKKSKMQIFKTVRQVIRNAFSLQP